MANSATGKADHPSDDDDGFLLRIPEVDRPGPATGTDVVPFGIATTPGLGGRAHSMPGMPGPSGGAPSATSQGADRDEPSGRPEAAPSGGRRAVPKDSLPPSSPEDEPVGEPAVAATTGRRHDDAVSPARPRKGVLDQITSWPALAALGLLTAFVVGYVALSRPTGRGDADVAGGGPGTTLSLDLGISGPMLDEGAGVEPASAADLLVDTTPKPLVKPPTLPPGGLPASIPTARAASGLPSLDSAPRETAQPVPAEMVVQTTARSGEGGASRTLDESPKMGPPPGSAMAATRESTGSVPASGLPKSGTSAAEEPAGPEFPVTEPATFRYHPGVTFPATSSVAASARAATGPTGRLATQPDASTTFPTGSLR